MTSTPPRLLLRSAALAAGSDDDAIRRLRRRGEWTALQRGAYLLGDGELDRRARHALLVQATLAGLRTPAVVSHASAAALHGLPLWRVPLGRVHVTREPPARTGREARLHAHATRVDGDTTVLAGVLVTSVARTVVDVCRSLPFPPGLAVADAALHDRLVTPEQLRVCLDASAGRPGCRAAARVVAAADGRSESVGESRSRAFMHEYGLPLPDLQVEVTAADGRFLGRTDFGWVDHRLLGEFDGRVKYGRLLKPGMDAGDTVFVEKRREDAIRGEGWGMVRWVWPELDTPTTLFDRIMRQLTR